MLSEKYERDVGNNAGHRAPAIYALAGFHRHTRSFDHEQHQQGAKRGDSAGENESAVKFTSRLHDIAGNNRPHDAGDAADKMDKAAGAADAGFMHHVLDNRPVDRPGYIEEKMETDISRTAGTTLLTVPASPTQIAAISRHTTSTILRDSSRRPVSLKILSEI